MRPFSTARGGGVDVPFQPGIFTFFDSFLRLAFPPPKGSDTTKSSGTIFFDISLTYKGLGRTCMGVKSGLGPEIVLGRTPETAPRLRIPDKKIALLKPRNKKLLRDPCSVPECVRPGLGNTFAILTPPLKGHFQYPSGGGNWPEGVWACFQICLISTAGFGKKILTE